MEQQRNQSDSTKLKCSICLDLLKDPVSTSCGHSYCMDCIKSHWDGENGKRIYSCPQCREPFTSRPVLKKNVKLADLVEELKTKLQSSQDLCYAGPEDMSCDSCTGRKLKAVKFCLQCRVYVCEQHLQPHCLSPADKEHQLVEPSNNLQDNICSRHNKMKEFFCLFDQQSICFLCTMDEHKGHETVLAAVERKKKQTELEMSRLNIQKRIQDRQKDVGLLQQELKDIKVSTDKTVEDSDEIINEMIDLLQNRRQDVRQQIRSQQKSEESRVKELKKKLEQEIRDLERKDAELKQLSDTPDHNQFLHNYTSVSALSESKPLSNIIIRPLRHFEDVTAAVKELRDHLQDILRDKWINISLAITEVDVLLSQPEPKTRDRFLKYSREITLDPNTANTKLSLSEGNRKVTFMKEKQRYPDDPDRFTVWSQVLSKQSLTGRCYWEVEWRGRDIHISVAKKNIYRKGGSKDCGFGFNNKSWSLYCSTNSYSFWHDDISKAVSGPPSSKIGVYLDHRAGILSFYSVSETMTLLHRVQTTFTEPIHAGVYLLYLGNTAEFLQVK